MSGDGGDGTGLAGRVFDPCFHINVRERVEETRKTTVVVGYDRTLPGERALGVATREASRRGGSLAVDRSTMTLSLHGGNAVCTGSLTSIEGGNLQGVCSLPSGAQVSLDLRVQADASSNLTGTLRASAACPAGRPIQD